MFKYFLNIFMNFAYRMWGASTSAVWYCWHE